jgi:molybdate transport system substrate-binding protein
VTVLAAASLTEPFTALATAYERDHPSVDVVLSTGSSTTLADQVAEGAPADVLATASRAALDRLPADRGGVTAPVTIARNTLAIATPAGNPARVDGLADLARPGLEVVLCASTAPCGAAADAVLARAGVSVPGASREIDARATLAKVRLGEADAAVVYRSDVVSAGRAVTGVALPPAENTTVDYPLVRLSDTPDAVAFTALVTGPEGRAALTSAGFTGP